MNMALVMIASVVGVFGGHPGCWLGSGHVHSGLKAGSSDLAHLQTSTVDRPKGSGGLARDHPQGFPRFGVARALWLWCFARPALALFLTQKAWRSRRRHWAGVQDVALACVTAKLFLLQPGRPEVTAGFFLDHPITCCLLIPVLFQQPLRPPASKTSAFSRFDRNLLSQPTSYHHHIACV